MIITGVCTAQVETIWSVVWGLTQPLSSTSIDVRFKLHLSLCYYYDWLSNCKVHFDERPNFGKKSLQKEETVKYRNSVFLMPHVICMYFLKSSMANNYAQKYMNKKILKRHFFQAFINKFKSKSSANFWILFLNFVKFLLFLNNKSENWNNNLTKYWKKAILRQFSLVSKTYELKSILQELITEEQLSSVMTDCSCWFMPNVKFKNIRKWLTVLGRAKKRWRSGEKKNEDRKKLKLLSSKQTKSWN